MALATVVLLAVHVWLTWSLRQPGPGADQFGYLGNARWLSGDSRTYLLPNFPYFSLGYPLVLTPPFWVFRGAEDLFRSVMVVNAVLASCLFPLLYGFNRVLLRAGRPVAGAAALVGALVPAVTYHSSFAMAENLVFPLVVATVLACWLMLSPRPTWQRVVFAPAVVLLYMTHERFTPVVPLAFVVILVSKRLGLIPARVATANVGAILALGFLAWRLKNAVVAARWVKGVARPQGSLLFEIRRDVLEPVLRFAIRPSSVLLILAGGVAVVVVVRRTRGRRPGRAQIAHLRAAVARLLPRRRVRALALAAVVVVLVIQRVAIYRFVLEAVGQAWYVAAGSLGLAVMGLALLVHRIGPAPSRTRSWSGLADRLADPRRLTFAFLLSSGTGVFVASTLFLVDNQERADQFIYGRHNDSFVPLWVAAGVVFVLGDRERTRRAKVGLVAAGTILVLTGILLVSRPDGGLAGVLGRGPAGLDGIYQRLSVPAVAPFIQPFRLSGGFPILEDADSLVPRATAVAVVAMAAISAASMLRRSRAVAIAACVALAGAWLFSAGADDLHQRREYRGWPAVVDDLGIDEVALDLRRFGAVPPSYQWHLPELDVRLWNRTARPGVPSVIADLRSPTLLRAKGRVGSLDDDGGGLGGLILALWVLPGSEQDRLEEEGRLLPTGFPGAFPTAVGQVELGLAGADAGAVVRVPSGESTTLTLEGRHDGSGSPWPDQRSFGEAGRMQLRGRPQSIGPGPRLPPAEAEAELPSWIQPGQSFRTTMDLRAVDDRGEPLPPGRYRFGIDVHQVDYRWFVPRGGEALDVVLEVTGRRRG